METGPVPSMEGIHFFSVSNDGFHFILFLQVYPECSHMLLPLSGPFMSTVTCHLVKNEGNFLYCVPVWGKRSSSPLGTEE